MLVHGAVGRHRTSPFSRREPFSHTGHNGLTEPPPRFLDTVARRGLLAVQDYGQPNPMSYLIANL